MFYALFLQMCRPRKHQPLLALFFRLSSLSNDFPLKSCYKFSKNASQKVRVGICVVDGGTALNQIAE